MENLHISDFEIPRIGLGTYQLTGKDGRKVIEAAIEDGYRHIDTAQLYENETEVGQAMRQSGVARDQLFLTTKIWTSDFNQLVQSTEKSLRRLGTDHVDLLLLHWPADEETTKRGLELLNEVLHKQYAKAVGVSNFTIPLLETAVQLAPIVCNQVEYHPFLSQEKLLDWMRSKGLFLTAYRPLAKGKAASEPLFVELAEIYSKTPGQLVLRWLIQQEGVAAIPKTSSLERLKENLDVFDFALSERDMERINALPKDGRMVDPEFGPVWD